MPTPPTWLPRLHEIRRAVSGSVRSHYERRDIERLFELQPRAAQKLLAMLPTTPVGKAHLVEREALAEFLDKVHETEDTISLFGRLRRERKGSSRQKLRVLIRRDGEPGTLDSLPQGVSLGRGRLEVSFSSLEDLFSSLMAIALLLDGDLDAISAEIEPVREPRIERKEVNEMALLYAELETLRLQRLFHDDGLQEVDEGS